MVFVNKIDIINIIIISSIYTLMPLLPAEFGVPQPALTLPPASDHKLLHNIGDCNWGKFNL